MRILIGVDGSPQGLNGARLVATLDRIDAARHPQACRQRVRIKRRGQRGDEATTYNVGWQALGCIIRQQNEGGRKREIIACEPVERGFIDHVVYFVRDDGDWATHANGS